MASKSKSSFKLCFCWALRNWSAIRKRLPPERSKRTPIAQRLWDSVSMETLVLEGWLESVSPVSAWLLSAARRQSTTSSSRRVGKSAESICAREERSMQALSAFGSATHSSTPLSWENAERSEKRASGVSREAIRDCSSERVFGRVFTFRWSAGDWTELGCKGEKVTPEEEELETLLFEAHTFHWVLKDLIFSNVSSFSNGLRWDARTIFL